MQSFFCVYERGSILFLISFIIQYIADRGKQYCQSFKIFLPAIHVLLMGFAWHMAYFHGNGCKKFMFY